MLAPSKQHVTLDAFEAFIAQPEHADRIFQLIAGEIVEVPSNTNSSGVGIRIAGFLFVYFLDHPIGAMSGEAGGWKIGDERYVPDVAVVLKPKTLSLEWFNSQTPDLVVEVDYPSSRESRRHLMVKVANYLSAGVVVWVVYPEDREVYVFVPGQPVKILTENDTLDGGAVLPGFTLAVSKIFDWE
jgi:Uma2 family endonuclease